MHGANCVVARAAIASTDNHGTSTRANSRRGSRLSAAANDVESYWHLATGRGQRSHAAVRRIIFIDLRNYGRYCARFRQHQTFARGTVVILSGRLRAGHLDKADAVLVSRENDGRPAAYPAGLL